jgi:hypothetical protein
MIRFTLIGDGSSDKTLLRIIKWAITQHLPHIPVNETFATFSFLSKPPKTLQDKIIKAMDLWPCDILFVHRDAEQTKDMDTKIKQRKIEIKSAISNIGCKYIAVIPVKMMETWLLTDEKAILKAAGNTNSTIELPKLNKLESISNPKSDLHEFLKRASGLKGRWLDSFNVNQAVYLVAEYTNDFSNLRQLKAFNYFEEDLKSILGNLLFLRSESKCAHSNVDAAHFE